MTEIDYSTPIEILDRLDVYYCFCVLEDREMKQIGDQVEQIEVAHSGGEKIYLPDYYDYSDFIIEVYIIFKNLFINDQEFAHTVQPEQWNWFSKRLNWI